MIFYYDKTLLKFIRDFNKRTHQVLEDFADCSICCLCCKDIDVPLLQADIKQIISYLKIDKKTFFKKHIKIDKRNPISKYLMNQPCDFLKNGSCEIYNIRPATCKDYPIYLYPGNPPFFRMEALEWCALSTNFFSGLIEFCLKYQPEVLKKEGLIDDNYNLKNEEHVIIKEIPFVYIYKYVIWLESKNDDEYLDKLKDFEEKYKN